MSASAWTIIAIVGFLLSGVSLAVTVILFFRLKIPSVIGNLTGKTVAREIKQIKTEDASFKQRKSIFDTYGVEETDISEPEQQNTPVYTERSCEDMPAENVTDGNYSTVVLSDEVQENAEPKKKKKTEILDNKGKTEVLFESGQTQVLSENSRKAGGNASPDKARAVTFKIVRSIVVIHSDEVIG